MRYTVTLIAFLCVLCAGKLKAKAKDSSEIKQLIEMETRILPYALRINGAETDSLRRDATLKLRDCLDSMLQLRASWEYPFDLLKATTVSVLQPQDKAFKLYTFNMVLSDGNFKNFGFVQYWYKKTLNSIPLIDTVKKWNKELLDLELDPTEWVGALYYKIVPFKKKGQKMYMLLGFDGSTIHSNKKIMEVLTLKKGEIKFGAPVFKSGPEDPSAEYRVIYEFHQQASMVLTYEEKQNIIVADRLAASFPEANNDYYYYIPTGDYDFYKQDKNGNWVKRVFDQFNVGTEDKDPEINPKEPKRKSRKF